MMDRRRLLLLVVPFLASCDAWEERKTARVYGEQGLTFLRDAQVLLSRPTLSPAEKAQARNNLTEALINFRLALAKQSDSGLFYDAEKYRKASATVKTLMSDPRFVPQVPP